MVFRRSLTKAIKKGLEKTASEFSECTPRIVDCFYYGAYDIRPQHLVIWFLFETDSDLDEARSSGLCYRITSASVANLISAGYPKESFTRTKNDVNTGKIRILNGTEEQTQRLMDAISYSCARVSFTSKEDIDRKANGDYHLYFK